MVAAALTLSNLNIVWSKGRRYAYYRRRIGGKNVEARIRGEVGSPQFLREYNRIHEAWAKKATAGKPLAKDSVAATIAAYRASPRFRRLRTRTKASYDCFLDDLLQTVGDRSITNLPRSFVLQKQAAIARDHPRQADLFVAVARRLLGFAMDMGLREDNPALRIEAAYKRGAGYRPWRSEETQALLAAAPPPPIRLGMMLGLMTGQRLGDVVSMRWSQVSEDGIEIKQAKTGAEVFIPLTSQLRKALNETKKSSVFVLANKRGLPYTASGFSHQFAKAVKKAGLGGSGLVFHGLRKTSTVILAEAGLSNEVIKAITGHTTDAMVSHYARLARARMKAAKATEALEEAGAEFLAPGSGGYCRVAKLPQKSGKTSLG